jgi:hypothetical protein
MTANHNGSEPRRTENSDNAGDVLLRTPDHTGSYRAMMLDSGIRLLREGASEDRQLVLDFIAGQTTLTASEARPFVPLLRQNLMHPDTQVRYFARRAQSQLNGQFPSIFQERASETPVIEMNLGTGAPLSTREILLQKLLLGSRYVAFEAMDRLTESGDPTLAEPLISYLEVTKDPYRISFLVKRLPRIRDPRIPETVATYLDHPDPRVVANAIEGLWLVRVPIYREVFARLAESPDNRIRGNAVRALAHYDPEAAHAHLQSMLESSSIALQDTGVYLLGMLRPPDLQELAEIALKSTFTTIRLKVLEIPGVTEPGLMTLGPSPTLGHVARDPLGPRDMRDLVLLLAAAVGHSTAMTLGAPTWLPLAILGILFLGIFMIPRWRRRFDTAILGIGLLIGTNFGYGVLSLPLALLAFAFPRFDLRRRNTESVPALCAWTFAVLATLTVRFIVGDLGVLLETVPVLQPTAPPDSFAGQLIFRGNLFKTALMIAFCGLSALILNLPAWFPFQGPIAGDGFSWRRQLGITIAAFLLMVFLTINFVGGLRLVMMLNGAPKVLDLPARLLGPSP